ncbi:MAG: cache domain-containing protein, partial [Anaerolineae bacterium]|nr:cache domain-containing protein [Anaerolineae bacterium]
MQRSSGSQMAVDALRYLAEGNDKMEEHPAPRWLIVALAVTLLILVSGGYWFYSTQEHQLRQHTEDELQAIAQLKVGEISMWRSERLADAAILAENPFFVESVARWLVTPAAAQSGELLAHFRSLQQHYHYTDVLLVDTDGQVLLSLKEQTVPLHEETLQALSAAWRDHEPVMTDLQAGDNALPIQIDVVAPLRASAESDADPIGALILQIDPDQYLYPLIQSWPVPDSSAETLLIRQDGDAVLFLNELRYESGTALTLRIPLTETDVPAVMAVQGQEGIVTGSDYRGVEVLSALKAIPDTPWFIISKVDTAEVFADWRTRAGLMVALTLGLMAAVGAAGSV